MAPAFFSKLVKPPSASRQSGDRDGLSRSGSPSPKSSSSFPRKLSLSSNLNPTVQVTKAPPSPSDASLSSDLGVTVIPPSPRSYNSSLQSDPDTTASVPGKEENGHETQNRPPSLLNFPNPSVGELDSGMPTPTPLFKNTLDVNNSHTLNRSRSSSTGNLRDRVRSVVSRSSSRSRLRTNQAEPPAPALPGNASSTANANAEMPTHRIAGSHAQPPSTDGPTLTIVPPAPTTFITGTGEFQTSPTSANAPTPKTRAFTMAVSNPTTASLPESHFLSPDRMRDSDSVSIASTASGRKRRLWRRSSTTSNSPIVTVSPNSPKRKTTNLASALVASVSGSGGNLTTSPSASPPRRKGSIVKRSPALSGHRAAASQSSVDSNNLQLSPPATRSRHNSLSARTQDHESDYASSVDGRDEDEDDDSDDDALLAELNDGDIPVTGFAVASNRRNADFHELFRRVPEGDYLIEDYGCALQREILVQGRIYISENHICFYANIFSWVTSLSIPIYEIVSLEKKMTAFVIPNAIQITTHTTKYTFASFLARDTAFDVIYNIWRLARPEDGFSENETMGRPALDESHALETSSPTGSPAVSPGAVTPPIHKVTYCACGKEGKHYSELAIDTVLPGTPERIYNLMFASGFLKDFMRDNQKLEDIQMSDWAPMPNDENHLARNMSYIKRLGGSIGPRSTRCEIRDETLHCDYDDYVVTLTTTRTPDVPSGSVFSVKTRTCITWASTASSRIVITSQVDWTGRSFIKGIIEKSAIEGQRTYQRELDRAMRIYIQEHQTEFIPAGLDPASVVVAVQGDPTGPTTPTGPGGAPQNEEAARNQREKQREQERNQRSLQWAYDTFEGALSVGRQSASVAIELVRDAWDQSSTSTILYFAIALLVLSNLWTLVLVGQREETGRRKELRKMEEREKWVQGIVTALWEELAAGRQPGAALPPPQQQQQQLSQQPVLTSAQFPESFKEEVKEILGALSAVEERVQLIRRSLADLD